MEDPSKQPKVSKGISIAENVVTPFSKVLVASYFSVAGKIISFEVSTYYRQFLTVTVVDVYFETCKWWNELWFKKSINDETWNKIDLRCEIG